LPVALFFHAPPFITSGNFCNRAPVRLSIAYLRNCATWQYSDRQISALRRDRAFTGK
jgi:hypothetical protein